MKTISVDDSNFEKIITNNYVYVDKTEYLYKIVSKLTYYFLSRPRRFGKSLTVKTLEAIYSGKKDLFKGLYIENTDWKWEEYPIIYLDFNDMSLTETELLKRVVKIRLNHIAKENSIELTDDIPEIIFPELIEKLNNKYNKGVVILVDEYDKPIISNLGYGEERLKIAEANREFLKTFYDNLKGGITGDYLEKVFITGVSKFTKVSIFSTLNNLEELDIKEDYADMLGYTDEELRKYFNEYFEAYAKKHNKTLEQVYDDFRYMYDGFRFTKAPVTVYNPYSIGRALSNLDMSDFWFESGTPTFLINLFKENNDVVLDYKNIEIDLTEVKAYSLEYLSMTALLFQTGYLTIKGMSPRGFYYLDYPNKEVEEGFNKQLLKIIPNVEITPVNISYFSEVLIKRDYQRFIDMMKSVLSKIPYTLISEQKEVISFDDEKPLSHREKYYHSMFYLISSLMSNSKLNVSVELLGSKSRIDMVIETPQNVIIFEFKCNQTSEKAIQQIKTNKYYERFLNTGKKIVLFGINFDPEEKNINDWKCEELTD